MIYFEENSNNDGHTNKSNLMGPIEKAIAGEIQPGGVIGIIAPTGPMLIDAWRACVALGFAPIILHYPTPKLSRIYWQAEIEHAVKSVAVELLLCADSSCAPANCGCEMLLLDSLTPEIGGRDEFEIPSTGRFLQMSSGTTGFRKGIEFKFADVKEHVRSYNEILNITPDDCIVSWLPLYHDMGFIATFLMPQILKCKLVLLDPISWVREPTKLWDAIERHNGTICYMPNFGFEVMAAQGVRCPPSMRLWVSCSEPTRAETMTRFSSATGVPPEQICNCWGMAENIFAVCQSAGIHARRFDEAEVVSCGRPIPGVDVKVVDGEIYVRSAYSLKGYIGLPSTLDQEGFYATGDEGEIVDGEIYLRGRRHDVMISAGRKTLLSDIDFAVGDEVPESAGRVCAFEVQDANLGTGSLMVLIEDPAFWRRNRDGDLLRRIIRRTGIETARAAFVPPRFITKTSSGKVNRKATKAHWLARENRAAESVTATDFGRARSEIQATFPWLDLTMPLGDQIDSLGVVNLGLIIAKYGYSGAINLDESVDDLIAENNTDKEREEIYKIVSLCDGNPFGALAQPPLYEVLSEAGRPVQFKQACVPPLPVLISDLIFEDYFQCRDDGREKYTSFNRVIRDIRDASVLLIDDSSTLFWPQADIMMVYPQLNHDFQAGENSRLLGMRWAGYSESHHLLRFDVVSGAAMKREEMNTCINNLSDYLGIPVVRIAYGADYPELTKDWEVQAHSTLRGVTAEWKLDGVNRETFEPALKAAILDALKKAPRRFGESKSFVAFGDQPHWCSWTVNPKLVDFIVENFDNIAILGKPSSVPYLIDKAAEAGRRVQIVSDLSVPEDCDCVVQTGSWGKPETDKPLFQVMAAGWLGEPAINLPPELQAICPSNR